MIKQGEKHLKEGYLGKRAILEIYNGKNLIFPELEVTPKPVKNSLRFNQWQVENYSFTSVSNQSYITNKLLSYNTNTDTTTAHFRASQSASCYILRLWSRLFVPSAGSRLILSGVSTPLYRRFQLSGTGGRIPISGVLFFWDDNNNEQSMGLYVAAQEQEDSTWTYSMTANIGQLLVGHQCRLVLGIAMDGADTEILHEAKLQCYWEENT